MPSLREILHNRTIQFQGRPSTPIDMEAVQNHLISKKQIQKQYFDEFHNAKPLPQLIPGQEVLFLCQVHQRSYIPGTIVDKASMLCSYTIKAQGKQYCKTREHICPIQPDIILRNMMQHLEPQQSPKLSCIPIPKPSCSAPLCSQARAHPNPNFHHPKVQLHTAALPGPHYNIFPGQTLYHHLVTQ